MSGAFAGRSDSNGTVIEFSSTDAEVRIEPPKPDTLLGFPVKSFRQVLVSFAVLGLALGTGALLLLWDFHPPSDLDRTAIFISGYLLPVFFLPLLYKRAPGLEREVPIQFTITMNAQGLTIVVEPWGSRTFPLASVVGFECLADNRIVVIRTNGTRDPLPFNLANNAVLATRLNEVHSDLRARFGGYRGLHTADEGVERDAEQPSALGRSRS
jgi:hypothetical protein